MKLLSLLFGFLDAAPSRIFASLGIGFLSFAAVTVAVNSFASQVALKWSGIGGEVLQILSLAGFPTAIGIVIGAVIARVSLTTLPKIAKIS